jgi:hypothetical protein
VVLEVTAKAVGGKEVFRAERHYHPQATNCRNKKVIYGAQWKASFIRDTSLQPYQTKAETFEITLPKGVRTVDVVVDLNYEISKPGYKAPIHKVTRRVSID